MELEAEKEASSPGTLPRKRGSGRGARFPDWTGEATQHTAQSAGGPVLTMLKRQLLRDAEVVLHVVERDFFDQISGRNSDPVVEDGPTPRAKDRAFCRDPHGALELQLA